MVDIENVCYNMEFGMFNALQHLDQTKVLVVLFYGDHFSTLDTMSPQYFVIEKNIAKRLNSVKSIEQAADTRLEMRMVWLHEKLPKVVPFYVVSSDTGFYEPIAALSRRHVARLPQLFGKEAINTDE